MKATYTNPLPIQHPNGGFLTSCADPTIIRGQQPGDRHWYMYCTTDPLNDSDRDANGELNFHLIPMLKSLDLIHWTYVGDVFQTRPAWCDEKTGLWAPEVQYFNEQYYLYYTVPETKLSGGGSAIGVATSATPLGPWLEQGVAIEPHEAPCCSGVKRWVFDPDVLEVEGQRYIYYGSYAGGISVRRLSADGLRSDPASEVQIAIPNRYEASEVVPYGDYYYLFVSATNCCNGPLTGYSIFVGRSKSPTGPFVDREGIPFLAGRVGGTPVLSMNGNRWVGPGHNAVFVDYAGQYWTVYHAVDRDAPYFEGSVGFTRRPVLLDRLDWIDGWPVVRGGWWASDRPEPVPAAQPEAKRVSMPQQPRENDVLGELIEEASDDFNTAILSPQWRWVREPVPSVYRLTGTTFQFDTQESDIHLNSNDASVLLRAAPECDYVVETKVKLNVPPEGCCYNFVQAGLVIYGDDDNFIKLAHVSIFETRQTEFAKEMSGVPEGYARYGNTVIGPPDEWTHLRIVKRLQGGEEHYTAYTSRNGKLYVRGGTWTHTLGSRASIGLVAMGGGGFVADFAYLRTYHIAAGFS